MGYSKYAICPCGWFREAPFGKIFHIHAEVCPRCGKEKHEWKVVTAKEVGFWNPKLEVIK